MSIRAIIWDLEGVLLLTPYGNVLTSVAHRLNISEERFSSSYDEDFATRVDKGEFSQEDSWKHTLEILNLPPSYMKGMRDFFYKDFYIDKDIVADIRAYRRQFKTALLSNFSTELRTMLSKNWRVDGAFDEIFISSEIHMVKPNPEVYRYALQKLGCAPEEAIFIDDREVNVAAAQALGIHAFRYTGRVDMHNEIQNIVKQESTIVS